MDKFNSLIQYSARKGFSDVHIRGGSPLVYRQDGVVRFDKSIRWTPEEIIALVKKILDRPHMETLKHRLSVDFARTVHNTRIRINVFNTVEGLSLAIRLLPGKAPSIPELNLHPSLQNYVRENAGLILIAGATGTGKTSTIASMIEEINSSRPAHIITLEDPIEFRFVSKKAFIQQREIGAHIRSYDQGLRDVLREDPDVIVVGELREPETIRLTLNAAEAGHLVIATIHATNSEDALHRICNSFQEDGQVLVRNQLSSTLSLLVVQRLVYFERHGFRIPVLSILRGSQSVKGLIRENRLAQIEGAIQTGRNDGMFTMDQYMEYLNACRHFTPPAVTFKPSAEGMAPPDPVAMPDFLSIDDEEPPPRTNEPKPAPEVRPRRERALDRNYVIEEEVPMDILLEELRRSDKY
jgi:twitching motility protein PilT